MLSLQYNLTKFLISVPNIHYLSSDFGIEIAFAGYSNTGKSSLLNSITKNKNLAYSSKYPGCTSLINFFLVKKNFYLVDLPGYGYAKTSKKIKNNIKKSIFEYIIYRKSLKILIILVDIRRSLKNFDKNIILLGLKKKISILVLLSKSDKISKYLKKIKLQNMKKIIRNYSYNIEVETFSNINLNGISKILKKLNFLYYSYKNFSNKNF